MNSGTQHRLRKHPDYQRVYKTAGRKQWAREIAWFLTVRQPGSEEARRSETAGPRIGLTVPKVLGKAVDRNRIKRRLREIVRHELPALGGHPLDLVLHPKRTVLTAEFAALEREVRGIFKAAEVRARKTLTAASPQAAEHDV